MKDKNTKEWKFKREASNELIEKLKKKVPLWQKLKNDCKDGEVFLAIRKNVISFYHKGGRIFTIDDSDKQNGLKTHVKYALIIKDDENDDGDKNNKNDNYISEEQLREGLPVIKNNFSDNYEKIKENCELYSGEEAKGVSYLLKNSTYLKTESDVVVLDIEIGFKTSEKKHDRIDILLYNTKTKILRFVEAKHFTNKEIWSRNTPAVIEQIKKYEEKIEEHKDSIITSYKNYVEILKKLFKIELPPPEDVDPKVSLLIFGFDFDQREGRLKELILGNKEYENIPIYSMGNEKTLKAKTIWEGAKKLS